MAAAGRGRETDVGEAGDVRGRAEEVRVAAGEVGQGLLGACAQREDLRVPLRRGPGLHGGRGPWRCLLEHHMGVRAAHAERGHPGGAPTSAGGPRGGGGADPEGGVGEIDLAIGCGEVQARYERGAFDAQCRLDEAGDAGRLVQVPDVGLHRADGAGPGSVRPGPEHLSEGGQFDRVAQGGARAVCLDVPHLGGIDPGGLKGLPHDLGLARGTGRGEADLLGPVVVDGRPLDDGDDSVVVLDCLLEPLQHHDAAAVAEEGSRRVGVEGPGTPVGGHDHAVFVEVAGLLRHHDVDTADEREVALPLQQAPAGLVDGDQRGRARRLHAHAGTAQVQGVGHPRGEVAAVVAELQLELFHVGLGQGLGPSVAEVREQVVDQVRARPAAGEDADPPVAAVARRVAGVFHGLPRALQEQPLLGVEEFGLPRSDAEERRVEPVDVRQYRPRRHEPGMPGDAPVALPLARAGQPARRLDTLREVVPERPDVRGAGEAPRHPDDRDVAVGGTRVANARRGGLRCALARRVGGPVEVGRVGPDRRMAQQVRHRQVAADSAGEFLPQNDQHERGAAEIEEPVVD